VIFGSGSASEWGHIFRGAGYVAGVAVRTVDDDFSSSDQSSFIAAGVPAVQLFSGAHEDIHTPGDTPEKIDADGLADVARVLAEAVEYLAERPDPLTVQTDGRRHIPVPPRQPVRRVTFGTVPDFSWEGDGVRLADVRAGTPAAAAGLREGDIIRAVNDTEVHDLGGYAAALRTLSAGDEIHVRVLRGDREQTISARVTER
jgi:hypothetical protein